MGQTKTASTGHIKTVLGEGFADVNVYISYKNQKYRVFASCLSELLGEVNMKYLYRKWFFTLTYDNVFNKKNYIYSTSSGLTESTLIYQIRPRSILLKIRYRIF